MIFASSGGAGYGECTGARRRADAVPAACRPTASPRSAARSTSPAGTASTARRTSRSASRTSTARARTPGSRAASSRSSSSASRAATRRSSTATALHSRDFVYVGDIVAALLAAVGHGGGPYNVGTGRDTTIAQLHEACARVAGSDAEPRHEDARLGDVRRSVLDSRLIERELGWSAEIVARRWSRVDVGVDEGARRAVAKRVALWTRHSMHPTH